MANYFNLTLDTTAPTINQIKLNDGAVYTTSRTVTLTIILAATEVSTTGYMMKIWGIDGVAEEANASWETYQASKQITLATGDGQKTVYVKVRDDVYNVSSSAETYITLNTHVPAVTVGNPDVTKISKNSGKDTCAFSFTSDTAFDEFKVKVVPSTDSLHDAGTTIGMTNGSTNMSGTGSRTSGVAVNCTIKGADLEAASAGDGQKIIKVFVKTSVGNWSL